jgi:hypothetical protein
MRQLFLLLFLLFQLNQGYSQFIKFNERDNSLDVYRQKNIDFKELLLKYKRKTSDTIDFKINISYSTITNTDYIRGLVFKENIKFDSVIFNNNFRVESSHFIRDIDFYRVHFMKSFNFESNFISQEINIGNCQFNNTYIWFNNVYQFNLRDCNILGEFSLMSDTIKILWITNSIFKDESSFSRLKSTLSNILFCKFNNYSFLENYFPFDSAKLSFLSSEFLGSTYFSRNHFPEFIDFSQVTSAREIDLINSSVDSLKRVIYINLQKSDISKIKLLYGKPFRISPPEYAIDLDELESTYTQLIDKQLKDGFYNSYISLDKEYKVFHNKYIIGGVFGWLSNFIQIYWWDFGHKKQLILFHTLFGILLFWCVAFVYFNKILNNGYEIKFIKERNELHQNSIITRMLLSMFYVLFIFFGFHLSFEKLKFTNLKISTFICFVYFYGLLCTAFLVNYIISS